MLTLLNQYGGLPFLKKVITAWHEAVVEERDIRHYFINVTPDILMKDQINYMIFIIGKTIGIEVFGNGFVGVFFFFVLV